MSTTEFQIKEAIQNLSDKLLQKHPLIPGLLREIHNQLKADPEIVTLLSEDEIRIVVEGLKFQTQTTIATSILKDKKKTLKSISVSDL